MTSSKIPFIYYHAAAIALLFASLAVLFSIVEKSNIKEPFDINKFDSTVIEGIIEIARNPEKDKLKRREGEFTIYEYKDTKYADDLSLLRYSATEWSMTFYSPKFEISMLGDVTMRFQEKHRYIYSVTYPGIENATLIVLKSNYQYTLSTAE